MDASSVVSSTGGPPVSYVTAVWLGMSPEDIERGVTQGSIAPPPGWTTAMPAAEDATVGEPVATSLETPSDASGDPPIDRSPKPDGKPLAIDRERVHALFRALDPSLDDAVFDTLWTGAGAIDVDRSRTLVGFLTRSLLGSNAPQLASGASTGDALAADATALDAFLRDDAHGARVVALTGKSGAELAELAKGDPAYRYALLNLDSMAIVGNAVLDTARNANGVLDRFDPNSGEQNVSDAWLEDRAKFLAWKLQAAGGTDATLDGDQTWAFIDRRGMQGDGAPYEIDVTGTVQDGVTNTVVFGADTASGEILKGGNGTDRMYGGSGGDVLRGDGGGDHLEGGRGDDLLLGGEGNDDVSGDEGADEIEGGSGTDRLQGGTGDDVLTGGRANDRLEGGLGHDIYVVDPGDGEDTVVDSDGDGELQYDGHAVHGAPQADGSGWRSADGRMRFTFLGDAMEGGTLTISYYAANAAPDAVPDQSTKISDWHNGDLGITLGDGSATALNSASQEQGTGATDVPRAATIPLIPHADGTSGNDGEGSTWIEPTPPSTPDPASANDASSTRMAGGPIDDVAQLFDQLSVNDGIAATFVTSDGMHSAVSAWDGVADAPDVQPSSEVATHLGVTPSDLTSALLDLADATHDLADHAMTAPTPPTAPSSLDLLQTSERTSDGSTANVTGTGRRPGG
jgi:Ca2+-binding RTX toxin-like protein